MLERLRRIDTRSLRVRLSLVLALSLGSLALVWAWSGWRTDLAGRERLERTRLEAVARSLATWLDGDAVRRLAQDHPAGFRTGEDAPEEFARLHEILVLVRDANELPGEVATLRLRPERENDVRAAPDRVHEAALELCVSSHDGRRWLERTDYVPAMGPALFEGRAASARPRRSGDGLAVEAFAPMSDAFGSAVGLVRVRGPWTSTVFVAALRLAGRLALAAALVGLVVAAASVVVRRGLASVDALEDAAVRMANGDFRTEVDVGTRTSELAVLSSSLEAVRLAARTRLEEGERRSAELGEAARVARERVAVQTEVLAGLGREARAPLSELGRALRGLAKADVGAEERRRLHLVLARGLELSRRLGKLLQQARVEGGEAEALREPFELRELVRDVAWPAGQRAREGGVALRVVVPETLPKTLAGDAGALQAILAELLDNALAATKEGSVTLRVWRAASQGAENLLRFEVADTGSGLSPAARSRFEALLADQDAGEDGAGRSGLALVRTLVRLVGGEMAFDSRQGTGTRVWFFARFLGETPPARPAAPRPDHARAACYGGTREPLPRPAAIPLDAPAGGVRTDPGT